MIIISSDNIYSFEFGSLWNVNCKAHRQKKYFVFKLINVFINKNIPYLGDNTTFIFEIMIELWFFLKKKPLLLKYTDCLIGFNNGLMIQCEAGSNKN